MAKKNIEVDGLTIRIEPINDQDYVNLTDIAKRASEEKPAYTIQNWIRNNNTIRYLAEWEHVHNKNIKDVQMHDLLEMFTNNRSAVSPQRWIDEVGAVGLIQKKGRGGGTYAHSDIALNFCYWLSPKFQIYFIKEFQRLKADEQLRLGDPFNIKRYLTSGNYSVLVSAIISQMDERLLTHPQPYKSRLPLAKEADIINKIVFGLTSKEWRARNTDKPTDRNQRDYASVLELTILNNLEFLDAMLIRWDTEIDEREAFLREAHEFQYPILKQSKTIKKLQALADKVTG